VSAEARGKSPRGPDDLGDPFPLPSSFIAFVSKRLAPDLLRAFT
jgi:hypothetical protein